MAYIMRNMPTILQAGALGALAASLPGGAVA
jgi:hypothetical protein